MLKTRLSIFPMDGLHAGFLGTGPCKQKHANKVEQDHP